MVVWVATVVEVPLRKEEVRCVGNSIKEDVLTKTADLSISALFVVNIITGTQTVEQLRN